MAELPAWYGKCENLRVAHPGETSNPFQAAVDIMYGTKLTLQCYNQAVAERRLSHNESSTTLLGELYKDVTYFAHIEWVDLAVVFALAFVWTIVRHVAVNFVFLPTGRKVGVLPTNLQKFGESAWKFAAYALLWSSAFYVTFYRGYDFFQRPVNMFSDEVVRHARSPLDLSFIYALETSFYVHSVYATLYMDAWRKDSVVMMVHHVITLILVTDSYSTGYLKLGVLIFVCDDISDVILESGKVATYLRHRSNGSSAFFSVYSDICSVVFAVQWVILRLQFHLTKVLRAATIGVWATQPVLPIPCHIISIVFIGSLYIFYSYWFVFIVMFVVRVWSGKQGTAEDPREDDAKLAAAAAAATSTEIDATTAKKNRKID